MGQIGIVRDMTSSSLPSPSSFDPAAEELFFTWQRDTQSGARPDFEALCRAHPQHERALRELRSMLELAEHLKPPRPSAEVRRDAFHAESAHAAELLERLRSGDARGSRYRMLGEVARGGMGAVLRVWDEQLRRTLAMKVVLGKEQAPSGDTPNVDPRTLGRFLEEAQITGQLDHPGIVPVHELGLDGAGRVYFTMKLVQGEDLEAVFKHVRAGSGDWNQVRALGVLLRVCEAVAYAHAKRVIHRDLKPANVMVGKFGEVYVMDWGMARVLGAGEARDRGSLQPNDASHPPDYAEPSDARAARPSGGPRTREGDVLGTPNYMPPEQAEGRLEHIGPHSDVYAIGAMLYQLVTARTPYASAPSSRAVLELVRAGPPTPVHELAPRTPAELIAIVEKAMSRAIDQRYRDTLALAEDLRAYLEGRVVLAYETGAWAQARKWVQRNKPLALSLATALLAVVSGAASFAWKAKEAEAARKDAVLNSERAERGESEAREQTKRAEAGERLARENAEEAERNALAAQLASEEATRRANDVLSLSAQKDLDDLIAEADELWPAHPEMIPAYEDWLRRARELIDGRPADDPNGIKKRPGLAEHKAKLAELRREARPLTEEELRAERESHPRFAELEAKRADAAGPSQEVDALSESVSERRTFEFDDSERAWWSRQLARLVSGLEGLQDPETGLVNDVLAEPFGWGVAKRYSFAKTIGERSVDGPDARRLWSEAIAAIRASPKYGGLEIVPQIGLLPIGMDTQSMLWEFAHLQTGEPAVRDSDGVLLLTEETGLVFVLLPGGRFWMGAQPDDRNGRNYDARAEVDERPPHEVLLSPFFLSKYEMTQGQWERAFGTRPSYYQPPLSLAPSLLHPVEQVSWAMCFQRLPHLGLTLPSEAQWEFAARGGTSTVWWTGNELESLRGKVNIADKSYVKARGRPENAAEMPDLDDGSVAHAAVGDARYAVNAFGLHAVAGNLWEWCLDGYDAVFYKNASSLDPVSPWSGAAPRVGRGGSFNDSASDARSANRLHSAPELRVNLVGVRPARALSTTPPRLHLPK